MARVHSTLWRIFRQVLPAVLLIAQACAREAPRPMVPLWEAERTSFHLGESWIEGVKVGAERPLPARRGGALRFKALAMPVAGSGVLELRTEGGSERVAVEGPTPVEWDLSLRGRASLAAPEDVVLVEPRFVVPGRKGRLILMVLADALRRDHASADVMPGTARFFQSGHVFEWAVSPETWTLPVMASLFTGKRPSLLRAPDGGLITLPPGETTLAETLAGEGFFCAGVCSNYTVNQENGYAQGFRLFVVPRVLDHGAAPNAAWVGGHGARVLDAFGDLDLFLYLHYMDLHEPYRNHETGAWATSFGPEERPAPGRVAEAMAAYASSARYLDRSLAPLLERAGPGDTVVLLADHGEEFGEHGAYRHGPSLHNETVRVPLMVRDGTGAGTWSYPVSTRLVHGYLARGDRALWEPSGPAVSETFAHGPPRIAACFPDFKFTAMAQPMRPHAPGDALERWVAARMPALRFTEPEERAAIQPSAEQADAAAAALAEQFHRFRRGIHLLVKGPGPFILEVEGVDPDGWVWGEPGAWKAPEGTPVRIEIIRADPFLLAFLPARPGRTPSVRSIQGPPLLPLTGRLPARIGSEGIWAWLDPGRPEAALQGIDETLLRLKALGYIQ